MSSHIEWTSNDKNSIATEYAIHGHYVANIIQLAVISLSIEHIWQIIDMNTKQVVKSGKTSYTFAMSLADPDDIIRHVRRKVEEELNFLIDMEEVEKILLGES